MIERRKHSAARGWVRRYRNVRALFWPTIPPRGTQIGHTEPPKGDVGTACSLPLGHFSAAEAREATATGISPG